MSPPPVRKVNWIDCPICAFFTSLSGVWLVATEWRRQPPERPAPRDPRKPLRSTSSESSDRQRHHKHKVHKQEPAGSDGKLRPAHGSSEEKRRYVSRQRLTSKWGDFNETVKASYLSKSKVHPRSVWLDDEFDESSEELVPEGLTDFIEQQASGKKRGSRKK